MHLPTASGSLFFCAIAGSFNLRTPQLFSAQIIKTLNSSSSSRKTDHTPPKHGSIKSSESYKLTHPPLHKFKKH